MTGVLILTPRFIFISVNFQRAHGQDFSVPEKVLASMFQSVSAETAGFIP